MTEITLRQTKGAPLTHDEVDQNFINLKETADAAFDAVAGVGGKANASAVGTDADATNMGTTPGTILSDNGTAKQWFQESEAAIEERPKVDDLASPASGKGADLINFMGKNLNFGNVYLGQDEYNASGDDGYLYHPPSNQTPLRFTDDGTLLNRFVYNGDIDDAYLKAPSPLVTEYLYGLTTPSSGTGIGHQINFEVGSIGTPAAGRTEVAARYGYVRFRADHAQSSAHNAWFSDDNILTKLTSDRANSPGYIVGNSMRMINLSAGMDIIDASHEGSFGLSVVANPADAATLADIGAPVNSPSKPLSALFSACGFSGAPSVTNGTDAGADFAAVYAYRAGGGGGNVYIGWAARSKFKIAYGAYDWTDVGIDVALRHPSGSGPGIRNIYSTELGGDGMTSANGVALQIKYNKVGPSRCASIQFGEDGNAWLLARDPGGTGGPGFVLYSGQAGKSMMAFDNTGVAFNGSAPIAKPTITGSKGGNAALANLLTQLANYGLITDSTS